MRRIGLGIAQIFTATKFFGRGRRFLAILLALVFCGGAARNATAPDIGADEFGFTGTLPPTVTGLFVNGGDVFTPDAGGTTVNGNALVNNGSTLGCGTVSGAGNFTLSAGATLNICDPQGIDASDPAGQILMTGARAFNTGANYNYMGGAAQITGDGLPCAVNNLTVNNSNGVTLTNGATVNGLLTLTNGDLITGSNILTQAGTGNGGLGSAAGGAGDVVGTVRRTDLGATARAFGNPDNFIQIGSGTAPTQMDVTLTKTVPSLSPAIKRAYTLTPAGGSGFTATVRLRYLDGEVTGSGVLESDTKLYRYNGTAWVAGGSGDTRDTTANWAQTTGVTAFSPWVIGGGNAPTLAVIKEYQAYRFDDGNLIRWQSSYEADNIGFRVYRQGSAISEAKSQMPNAKGLTLITPNLIAGSVLMAGSAALTAGHSYSWFDANASADSTYYVEDLDLNGETTLHGPIRIAECGMRNAECGNLPRTSSLTLDQLRPSTNGTGAIERQVIPKSLRGNGLPQPGSDPFATQLDLAGRAAVKLGVLENGWYRVAGAQLFAAGLSDEANARFLQLYRNGEQVPMGVLTSRGGSGGVLGATGVIEFYGISNDTRESDTAIYWLIVGDSPGLRIGPPARNAPTAGNGDVEGGSSSPQSAGAVGSSGISNPASGIPGQEISDNKAQNPNSSFAYTVERKDRTIYLSTVQNGEAENFFGALINSTASPQTLRVNKLAANVTTPASLSVALQGATANAHQVAVSFNGTQVGVMSFTGRTRQVSRFDLPHSTLTEGDNTVTLRALNGSSDISVTDYLRLTYQHRYEAHENRLLFPTGNRNGLRITGFTQNRARVFDLTEPGRYSEVSARTEADGNGYAVNISGRLNNRQLFALADNQALSPVSIEANEPSAWTTPAHAAEFIIVTPRAFRAAAAPLAAARQQQGLRTVIVNVEDIFDEWSGGAKDVQAVRGFLRYAKENWQTGPGYVLLLGDASYDPRNYRGFGETDLIPTAFVGTDFIETASDDTLADFNEDGIGEMSVGRLPARTLAQAQALVARVLGYAPHNGGALLVADRPDGYNFVGLNQQVRDQLPANMAVTNINREGQDDATVRNQVLTGLNGGPSLVQYAGHGSVQMWTSGGILDYAATGQLTNGNRLPLVVSMTCMNGFFYDLSAESLAEGLLNAPNGGAIAVWASSALTDAGQQAPQNVAFIEALYSGNGMRVGDAARQAKGATNDLSVRRSWILLGDPTLRLR